MDKHTVELKYHGVAMNEESILRTVAEVGSDAKATLEDSDITTIRAQITIVGARSEHYLILGIALATSMGNGYKVSRIEGASPNIFNISRA